MTNDPTLPRDDRHSSLGYVGSYELLLELAAGGMASVYLARAADGRTGPPLVAVKRPHRHLAGDPTFLSMLVDEARLASRIDHPNVVRVRELGFDRGEPFIVMDYVEGGSLAELRKELSAIGRAMELRLAVRIILDALAGLDAAHEQTDGDGKKLGIIHRDVSPHNVLVGCDGRVHLTDFGIAKAESRVQVTRSHEVKGKLAYLAPERVDKRRTCTIQSDVFSMGVVLWECVAGRRLFRAEGAAEVIDEVARGPIPRLEQIGAAVPKPVSDVIARALARDFATRFATARDFASALETSVRGNQGTREEIAMLMEAVFGARMANRHERLRAVLPKADAEALLTDAGLRAREAAPTDRISLADEPSVVALAPPAPSERYAFSAILARKSARRRRLGRIAIGVSAVLGGSLGIGLALWLRAKLAAPKPATTSSAVTVAVLPPVRHVVVPLPFVAARVVFDEQERELHPPSDVTAFDLPTERGARHRLVLYALDGTRAEGYLVERDGIAHVEDGGFARSYPLASAAPSASTLDAGGKMRPSVGSTRDGFTKLR